MNRSDRQRVFAQLELVIEQSHRLQLELIGLMRSVMEIESPASVAPISEVRDAPADLDLPDKPTFSVTEAAAILGVARDTVYRCASVGEIPTLRLGRRLLIPRTALVRLIGGQVARPL